MSSIANVDGLLHLRFSTEASLTGGFNVGCCKQAHPEELFNDTDADACSRRRFCFFSTGGSAAAAEEEEEEEEEEETAAAAAVAETPGRT
jgi:hypothetical protein